MPKRLLICYAHPDDESFGLGAFIAKCTAEGIETYLICTTNGDVGTVSPEKMVGYNSIGELRLAELECASQVLGFKEVIKFGYRDSGMMGSEENKHPNSSWQVPDETMAAQVLEHIKRIQPQVIITFDPYGGYGHPDHIKIHKGTLKAFHDAQSVPGITPPQRLYYTAFPRAALRVAVVIMRIMGKDPRHMGTNKDMDFQAVLDATLPVHAKVDVAPYYEIGQKAAACHASQSSPRNTFPFARILFRRMAAKQQFYRYAPEFQPGERLESDIFANIK